jgi:hypothetical protein
MPEILDKRAEMIDLKMRRSGKGEGIVIFWSGPT